MTNDIQNGLEDCEWHLKRSQLLEYSNDHQVRIDILTEAIGELIEVCEDLSNQLDEARKTISTLSNTINASK